MTPSSRGHRCALALAVALSPAAFAQEAAAPDMSSAPRSSTLDKVVITGSALGSGELAVPVSVLTGDELVLKRGSSLGDTLNSQPGVSSSYFGPNANRPMIRGMEGERVRILSNAGASLDASTLSFDHALPIDPLIIERIEVLRGPGALPYGGGAVGGVVNTLDNRIPKQRLDGPSGALELRLGGAQSEAGGAALAETGNGRYALHVDAFGRSTSDLRTPLYVPLEDGSALAPATTVRNSFSRTRGGAAGGSLFIGGGYVGLSADTYDSRYGTPAEPDVHIEMKRDHVGLAFEAKDPGGLLSSLRGTLNDTDYRHREVDGTGRVGTTFTTSGNELRLEAQHRHLGSFQGSLGLQWEDVKFAALGEEAFVPSTRTTRQALFALEETPWFAGTLSGGVRLERAKVASAGDEGAAVPRFGAPSERTFSLRSASVANVYKLNPQWSLNATFSTSERAPTSFELYADGVHAATGAFERGDAGLPKERGSNLDVALQWKSATGHLRMGVFSAYFPRFLSLEATGRRVDVTDAQGQTTSYPEFIFRAVRARMKGVELDGRQRLLQQRWTVDGSAKLDVTYATQADSGEPLPRVAPLRVLLGLDASRRSWATRLEVEHAQRQGRVPSTDTATPGYTLVNASLTRRFTAGDTDGLWFVKLNNIGDRLAYSASTVQTVRGLSPLPGRSLATGVRLDF